MRPCWGSSRFCTESDLDINFPHWQKWLDQAKPIHDDAGDGTTVIMLQDEEHFVKEGPTDLIAWEYQVYTRMQLHFPTVCERFLDLRWGSKQGLLLHLVVCFRDIFKGDAFPRPSRPFTYASTALCASHLIFRMRIMHYNDVLHRDIHPGNVGFLCAHDSGIQPAHITMQQIEGRQDLFTPTFIDYQWSTMEGYHPRTGTHMPPMAMWSYLSDRFLREPNETYSAADDLESLAYTLLDFRLMGELPWAREIDARSNPFSYDVYSREHRDFVIATRNQHLDGLFNSCTAASPSSEHPVQVEKELLDFIQYARNLERSD
ncbi:hypothetical protein LXA43DRAFT_1151010, partial [Ganoderma leucocontextum]